MNGLMISTDKNKSQEKASASCSFSYFWTWPDWPLLLYFPGQVDELL